MHNGTKHVLKRLKRLSVTSNEQRKVGIAHIKNQLAVATIILIDGCTLGAEETKERTENLNRGVGNKVKVVIGKGLMSLVLARHLNKLFRNQLSLVGRRLLIASLLSLKFFLDHFLFKLCHGLNYSLIQSIGK